MQGKYKNIKAEYNGAVYDSRKEMRRAVALDWMVKASVIRDLERQKAFVLQDGYVNNWGEKIRPIQYVADFVYFDNEKGQWIVEDVKSPATRTDVYRIKKKLFEAKYPEYWFVES
ncbi:MAG: DUF1064 domain-containing protein [Neisseriaceae bacterium]|nr:DUF1064 domain-containing protein [Neisseriaceae bacterium]